MQSKEDSPLKIPSIQETRDMDFFQPYVNTLKKIFAEILGWPEALTLAHIDRKLQERHFRCWFGHDTPCHDAASVIVPASLMSRLIERRISTVHICNDIWLVLEGTRETYNMFPDTDPDYDWQRARDEIADIIKEYERQAA